VRIFSRKLVRLHACWVITGLLFAQLALAAEACVMPAMAPAMMSSASQPCEDMGANVCLAQFLQGDQAFDGAGIALTPPQVPALIVNFAEPTTEFPPGRFLLLRNSGPPIRTRICRLLI
jgi:hypothetical protein